MQTITTDQAVSFLLEFPRQVQTAMLATINDDGTPNASYAPFVWQENNVYQVFVSGMARHGQNLQKQSQVSLMLVEDESTAVHIFARKRLTWQCRAVLVERGSNEWQKAESAFGQKYPGIFDQLKLFADFQMYNLLPAEGLLVLGFGSAWTTDAASFPVLKPKGAGHRQFHENGNK